MLFCIVTFNLWLHFNKLLTYLLTYLYSACSCNGKCCCVILYVSVLNHHQNCHVCLFYESIETGWIETVCVTYSRTYRNWIRFQIRNRNRFRQMDHAPDPQKAYYIVAWSTFWALVGADRTRRVHIGLTRHFRNFDKFFGSPAPH